MTFKFQLVERVREHYAKHSQNVAAIVPPEAIAIATAVEAEMQRFADHMREGLERWQKGIDRKVGRPEDGA